MDQSRFNQKENQNSGLSRKRSFSEINARATDPAYIRKRIKFGEAGEVQSIERTQLGADREVQSIEHRKLENGKVRLIEHTQLGADGTNKSIEYAKFSEDGRVQSIQIQDIQLGENGEAQHIKFKDIELNDQEGTRLHKGYKLQRELEKIDIIKERILENSELKKTLMQHSEIKKMFQQIQGYKNDLESMSKDIMKTLRELKSMSNEFIESEKFKKLEGPFRSVSDYYYAMVGKDRLNEDHEEIYEPAAKDGLDAIKEQCKGLKDKEYDAYEKVAEKIINLEMQYKNFKEKYESQQEKKLEFVNKALEIYREHTEIKEPRSGPQKTELAEEKRARKETDKPREHTQFGKDGKPQVIRKIKFREDGKAEFIKRTTSGADGKARFIECTTLGADGKVRFIEHTTLGVDGKARLIKHTTFGADGKARLIERTTLGADGKAEFIERTTLGADGKVRFTECTTLGADGKPQSIERTKFGADGKPQYTSFTDKMHWQQQADKMRNEFIEAHMKTAEFPTKLSNLWEEARQLKEKNEESIKKLNSVFSEILREEAHDTNEAEKWNGKIDNLKITKEDFEKSNGIWTRYNGGSDKQWKSLMKSLEEGWDKLDESSRKQLDAKVYKDVFSPLLKKLTFIKGDMNLENQEKELKSYIGTQKNISDWLEKEATRGETDDVLVVFEKFAKYDTAKLLELKSLAKSHAEQAKSHLDTEMADKVESDKLQKNITEVLDLINASEVVKYDNLTGNLDNIIYKYDNSEFDKSAKEQWQTIANYRKLVSGFFHSLESSSQALQLELEKIKQEQTKQSGSRENQEDVVQPSGSYLTEEEMWRQIDVGE